MPQFDEDETLLCPPQWETATEHYDPAGTPPEPDGFPVCAGCGSAHSEHVRA